MTYLDKSALGNERWVIFCRVIDNLGDAGVTWRLAKQLAREYSITIDLVIDRPELIAQFESATQLQALHESITIWMWPRKGEQFFALPEVGDVTIAAFACHLPDSYRKALAHQVSLNKLVRTHYWFNLEYLSAEPWIDSCHLLGSTKPEDSLTETFFFPGFTPQSGGLLKENFKDSTPQQLGADALLNHAAQTRQRLNIQTNSFAISLFCYVDAPVRALLKALNQHAQEFQQTIELVVTRGVSPELVAVIKRVAQSVVVTEIDFLPQDQYDELLACMDLNFVRGEDSVVRAIWAKKPFIWQAYPQDQATQRTKIDHFCENCFGSAATSALATIIRDSFYEWNFSSERGLKNLSELLKKYSQWAALTQENCDRLSLQSDLAMRLIAASRKI